MSQAAAGGTANNPMIRTQSNLESVRPGKGHGSANQPTITTKEH